MMRSDVCIVAKKEVADLPTAEMAARMASGTEKQRRKLVLDKLRIFSNISMKPIVDDVVCSPEIHDHVVTVTDSTIIHWEENGSHVHEVLSTVLTSEERTNPSLDCLQRLQWIHFLV